MNATLQGGPAGPSGASAPGVPFAAPIESVANRRILVVDDNPAIHADFRKALITSNAGSAKLLQAEAVLFGDDPAPCPPEGFEIDCAYQGDEALEKVQRGLAAGKPYAMAFLDVRMPPGWDGIETVSRIWARYPELQVVICTAYSDYSWNDMITRLGAPDNLVILKKPFDEVEVLQLAHTLTRKWELNRLAQLKLKELNEMVASRTGELEAANLLLKRESEERLELERQFRHAQKMDVVGQLAAGVAHDFNNILTIIHGHASMLGLQLGEEGPHARSLSQIRSSAERAANLVRQLLTFSRKHTMQFRNVDLSEVISSISGMLRQLVGEHITLTTECAPGLPAIYADRGMIEQVIVNLSVNARDAIAREGRITIRSSVQRLEAAALKAGSEARAGEFVCLTVADNGCGIEAGALGHLFEPFFTTKEVGKGTGLGLATVYGIVKEHLGWIEVDSQASAGATFRIYFPPSQEISRDPPEAPSRSATARGTETILLAEDEPSVREMMTEVLTLGGYRVLAARTGPAALELWRREQGRIDLLLTDMVMPGGMRGHDLAAELRLSNPHLKVIYTSGYNRGLAGNVPLREGLNFLAKPYLPHELAEIVRRCLDSEVRSSERV